MTLFLVIVVALLLVVGGAFAGVAVLITGHGRNTRRRAEGLAGWAAAHGWSLTPSDPQVAGVRCPPTRTRGSSRTAVRGTDPAGRPGLAFEWAALGPTRYDEYGSSTAEEFWHVVATPADGPAPGVAVEIAPRRQPGRLLAGRGGVPTGVAAFDERFETTVEGAASVPVPEPVASWWASDPRAARTGLRLEHGWAVCWRHGHLDPASLDETLALLTELRARLADTRRLRTA